MNERTLESILGRQLLLARQMGEAVEMQREAVRRADEPLLRSAGSRVRALGTEMERLEAARQAALRAMGLPAGATVTNAIAAMESAGQDAAPLRALAEPLGSEVTRVRRRLSVVRAASERLAAHLAGVRELVCGGKAAVYGRRGRVNGGPTTTLDLRH